MSFTDIPSLNFRETNWLKSSRVEYGTHWENQNIFVLQGEQHYTKNKYINIYYIENVILNDLLITII